MAAAVVKGPSGGVRRARPPEFVGGRCLHPSASLRRRGWAWQGPLRGFRAGLGAMGRDGAQP